MTDIQYAGHPSQLFDVRKYRFSDGRADGVEAVDIWNGGNLSFTVLPGRCCDLYSVRYRGYNMAFHSPAGVVHTAHYDDQNWLRSFAGGFLTTCGLQNIGRDDPKNPENCTHGRISHVPAENVGVLLSDDGMEVTITGLMREAVLFGAKLSLKRTLTCRRGADEISIIDVITNHGYTTQPLCMLYHFNLGYPLINERSTVVIPSHTVVPRNDHAASDLDNWSRIYAPAPDVEEMCYYHFLRENRVGVDSPDTNTRMRIAFSSSHNLLDRLVQWRMFGCGDYVLGLEPSTCTLEGQSDAAENGSLKTIAPQTSVTNTLTITFEELQS